MMRRGSLIALAVAVVLVGAGILIRAPAARRAAPPLPTQVLLPPAATLAGLRGHPAIVAFWASWCEPCIAEASQLERFAQGGGRIVGVSWSDPAPGAHAFLSQHGWTFPNLADPDGSAGRSWGITNLPTAFVLDAQGRIVATLHGPQTAAKLQQALRSA